MLRQSGAAPVACEGKDDDLASLRVLLSWGTVGSRVGFAYDVFGDGKTALRGGYGISHERNLGNVTFNVVQDVPNNATVTVFGQPLAVSNLGPFAGSTCPPAPLGCGLPPVKSSRRRSKHSRRTNAILGPDPGAQAGQQGCDCAGIQRSSRAASLRHQEHQPDWRGAGLPWGPAGHHRSE
jgi:hypothetical protein